MLGYFLYKILPAILILSYVIYLLYVRYNPDRRKAILSKYKKGTAAYDIYSKIYSPKFLTVWILLALSIFFSLVFDLYRSTHTPPLFVLLFWVAIFVPASLISLYLLTTLFREK
jgi:hypothetical protein